MRIPTSLLIVAALAVPGVAAADDAKWTFSGQAGIATGDQTGPSFSWRLGGMRWHTPGAGMGLQFGRMRWEANDYKMVSHSNGAPFEGLEQGGHELYDLSFELRFRSNEGAGRGAFIAIGAGSYWQNVREDMLYAMPASYLWPMDNGDGDANLGWHVASGGMGIRGLAPGAEFGFDWIESSPRPSAYFTASAALHLGR